MSGADLSWTRVIAAAVCTSEVRRQDGKTANHTAAIPVVSFVFCFEFASPRERRSPFVSQLKVAGQSDVRVLTASDRKRTCRNGYHVLNDCQTVLDRAKPVDTVVETRR